MHRASVGLLARLEVCPHQILPHLSHSSERLLMPSLSMPLTCWQVQCLASLLWQTRLFRT